MTALGLIILAAITYAEQRSFQLERADDRARAPLPAVERRFEPEHQFGGGPGGPPPGGRPGPDAFDLPSGVYAEVRDASGEVQQKGFLLGFGQTAPAPPSLPEDVPTGDAIDVDSGGTHYRVRAFPSRELAGATTLVAVPLTEVDRTLNRLLLVEGLVIGGVLLGLAALAWWLVRLGLRPLERMGATADAIAAGD